MNNTLTSIIIPAHNAEQYITRAIDSVLDQTHKNIEVIVVNDGSKDNTEKIVKSYGNKIQYFYQENKGVGAARNLGIKKSKGKYIGFLDADDYVLPSMYSKLLKDLQKKDSDIAMCNIFLENEYKVRVKAFQLRNCTLELKKSKDIIKAFKYLGNSSCNKLYLKSILNGIRFTHYKRGEDALFILECWLSSKRISVRNESLYIYFQNSDSASKSGIDLPVIDNFIQVHIEKRNLIYKYNKIGVLDSTLKNYYIKTFLMRTNKIRKVKDKIDKEYYWQKWYAINEDYFLQNTFLMFTFKLSKNINWIYYSGMIISAEFVKPILDRIKNLTYYFNK